MVSPLFDIQFVIIEQPYGPMNIQEVMVFDDKGLNVALNKSVTMSSYWGFPYFAHLAVDGDITGRNNFAHSSSNDPGM